MIQERPEGWSGLWDRIRNELRRCGIDLETLRAEAGHASRIRMVCVASDLKESVKELGQTSRDQVVMVRLDEETTRRLDAWVETGAVRSRSEAAALFIREGLKVRSRELSELDDALEKVELAKKQLREKAREVFGEGKASGAS